MSIFARMNVRSAYGRRTNNINNNIKNEWLPFKKYKPTIIYPWTIDADTRRNLFKTIQTHLATQSDSGCQYITISNIHYNMIITYIEHACGLNKTKSFTVAWRHLTWWWLASRRSPKRLKCLSVRKVHHLSTELFAHRKREKSTIQDQFIHHQWVRHNDSSNYVDSFSSRSYRYMYIYERQIKLWFYFLKLCSDKNEYISFINTNNAIKYRLVVQKDRPHLDRCDCLEFSSYHHRLAVFFA